MKTRTLATVAACMIAVLLLGQRSGHAASPGDKRLVRIAELEIDPASLAAYKIALRREIEASIRSEPGVLSLYAVSVAGQPNQIRLFEIYASSDAYQAHLRSEHFRRYKSDVAGMAKSLRLIETEPVLLGSK